MKNFIKNIIPYISTLLLVGLMVGIAELLNEKEIIFPEITALAVGYMVAQKRSWKVNGKRMLLLITICATVGVLIVRYSGLTLFPQMIIAFFFCTNIIYVFRYNICTICVCNSVAGYDANEKFYLSHFCSCINHIGNWFSSTIFENEN